jgi:adiponectin receptor
VAAFYLVFIVSGALTLFIVSLLDFLHRPENKTIKALCFGGFGIALGIPLFHIALNEVIFDNYGDPFRISGSLPFHLVSGFAYLFGLYIYTVRCPERGRPGKFNVCGHSHQIWHCFVVMGIIFSYMAVMDNF